jgi:PD-(D/E)XK endonuclease
MLTPREQGDFGELSAICWLISKGAHVAVPVGCSPHWDLMAELDGRPLRVQVKTSRCFVRKRWDVTLCTRGGNQSWNGIVKRLEASRYDFLFVLVADGRRWFIPSDRVAGGSGLLLGGPKYADFEVERGDPIPHVANVGRASTIVSSQPSGGCPSG